MPYLTDLTIGQSIVRGVQHIQQLLGDQVDHSMPDTQPAKDVSDINTILGPHELLRIFDCLSHSDVLGGACNCIDCTAPQLPMHLWLCKLIDRAE